MLELLKDENFKTKYNEARKQRELLSNILKNDIVKIEKTTENIHKMAKENGIKPTARYFNIDPSSVRYHVKKYNNRE